MSYITPLQYYYNDEQIPQNLNWGSYQYVKLVDIVNNFMLMYTGNHSLINNEERYKVVFHAKRAIQELNYDAFKEVKALILEVYDPIRYILPPDYVNWIRLSIYKDGNLYPLSENTQNMSALTYLHDNEMKILFDQNGYCLSPEHSSLDYERAFENEMGVFNDPTNQFNGMSGYQHGEDWYFSYGLGKRFGLDTENSNKNPKFTIDGKNGVINFFSDMSGEECLLEYVCDGMENGREEKMAVNKLFEKYVYAYIKYEILNDKLGVQEYIVTRARKERRALFMNAKIRSSNIHPSRLLMYLRGMDKIIK
jgi:hypothetical protein